MTEAALSLDTVMARRFELVEQMAILAGKHKAELQPMNEELSLCETFIKDTMNTQGMQQAKTDAGMAYFTTKDSVTVKDMDSVIRFMLEQAPKPAAGTFAVEVVDSWKQILDHLYAHGMWGLLNKAVNKTAAKELIEAQTPPPGVEYSSYKDLAWRRGK